MGEIVEGGAWCNGEVAYLAWRADGPIEDCLGFQITRVHETGPEAGRRRILPTWIAFTDQSNPDWLEQDASVWPIQQYQWRDLTLRRSRDTTRVRPIDFRVHYEILAVGPAGPGRPPLPVSPTAHHLDDANNPRYIGPQHPLGAIGSPFVTGSIDVTHAFPAGGAVKATFTNGILSTQNLRRQLEDARASEPRRVAAGPTTRVTEGLLKTLLNHIPNAGDRIREFLTGDVLSFLLAFMDRAETGGGELHLALYELHDPELIERLTRLTAAGKAHVILSTAGSSDPNPKKNPPRPRLPFVWGTENHEARKGLHAAGPDLVQDRLFNNNGHIGHNKFAVLVEGGVAKAVLTGSTNWTETGLCTQSNNVVVIEDEGVARRYLEYWRRLKADVQPAGVPAQAVIEGKPVAGFAPNDAVQGAALRAANAEPAAPLGLDAGSKVEVYFAPNTAAPTKNKSSPTPIDLGRVYGLMEHARQAIFFLTFFPGVRGEQNIIGQASALAETRPDLLIQGAISNPLAMPPGVPGEPTTYVEQPSGATKKLPSRAIWWPRGDESRIVMLRAAAIGIKTGDLRPELLSAGRAIIHDKIIVVDPLDADTCAVITGSHNLGYKASYQNDENLLVLRGNRALAIAYAVHVLDVYDHYVMRARLQEERRKTLIETGREPAATAGGFLRLNTTWQEKWFDTPGRPTSRDYFLRS